MNPRKALARWLRTQDDRSGAWRRLAALLAGSSVAATGMAAPLPDPQPAPPSPAPSPKQAPRPNPAPASLGPVAAADPGRTEASPQAARRADGEPPRREILAYKTVSGQALTVQLVRPDPVAFPGPRPAVVLFHGGGWRRGAPGQMLPYCEALAAVGVVGLSARYSLLSEREHIPRQAVMDARSALRWVRREAGRLNVDPQRIGAGGGSSGGHLAVMTALGAGLDDPADDRQVSAEPGVLLLMNPPLDLSGYDSPVPLKEREALSPLHLLRGPLPPTLIVQGTKDQVVPPSQARAFQRKAQELGSPVVELHLFQGRKHGFFNAKQNDGEDFDTTVADMTQLLRRIGWVR